MADNAAPRTLAERIAALNMAKAASDLPNHPPPSYEQAVSTSTTSNVPLVGRKRPPPPTPPRPALPARPQTSNVPATNHVITRNTAIGNQPEAETPAVRVAKPALPARATTQSSQASDALPNLPPRRPSEQPSLHSRRPSDALSSQTEYDRSRRGSDASTSSVATTRTSLSAISDVTSLNGPDRYRVRAPEFDVNALPALPPKRTKEEKEADSRRYAGLRPLRPTKSGPKAQPVSQGTTPPPPLRPAVTASQLRPTAPTPVPAPAPVLPQRTSSIPTEVAQRQIEPPPLGRQPAVPPPPTPSRPRKSPLDMGFGTANVVPPPTPLVRPGSVPQPNNSSPPPTFPAASKPDLAALQASKPKMNGAAGHASAPASQASAASCLHCRDFSAADAHAARFPRETLPYQDVGWLAEQLTAPFPTQTDKARAIFTWLHHNVAYDTYSFFNNCVKPSTPLGVLQSGLAVCEGYASMFSALALKAGLEVIVISGASKGYGHTQLGPGEPLKPFKSTHAWNAVRLDDGKWKLIDCCWGAGSLCNNVYKKRFSPERFTQDNTEFGLDHFPTDTDKQLREDARTQSWEEFSRGAKGGCGANFFSGLLAEEGLCKITFRPWEGKIAVSGQQQGPTVRFSFQKVCPHWDPVRNGKGPYYLHKLMLEPPPGSDGQAEEGGVFQTNGEVWWCDVRTHLLRPGGKASICAMTDFCGTSARGLTEERYKSQRGGSSWGGVCNWDII